MLKSLSANGNDGHKTKAQLIAELAEARQRVRQLETAEAERRQVEAALRENEERLTRTLETMPGGLAVVASDGQIVLVNQAAEQILGLTRGDITGRACNASIWKIAAVDGGPFPDEQLPFAQVMQTQRAVYDVRHSIERSDGARVILSINAAPLRNAAGQLTGVVAVFHNITARSRARIALQESERKLREAQEMAHLGFWHWDIKSGDVEWSEEVFKIFGLDPKEFTPHIDSILALSPWPEDHQRDKELINRAIETHSPGSYEQKFLRPDQSIGHYYSTFRGNYAENGDLKSIVGTVLDITERKRAEEALQRRAAQLMLLSKVGNQIAIILELKNVFDTAVRLVQESFGYHHVALFMVDHAQSQLIMQARAGEFALLFPPDHRIPLGHGVVGWVGLQGKDLVANDVSVEPRYVNLYPKVIPTRSELAVPIRAGGATVGVLDVQSPHVNAFDENDVLVIKTLADQIAVAIENARLYEAVQQELSERKRAEETIQNLAKFPGENPSPVFRLNADGLILYANEASHVLLREWQCRVGEPAPQMWRELCVQALATRSRHTLDYGYDGEMYAFVVTPVVEFNYVNLYAINITIRKQAEDALRRSAQRLEILHHIDWAMLTAQSPQAVAETALLRLRDLIPFQLGGIVLFDADEMLVLAAVPGDGPTLYSGLRLPAEPGWIAALQRGQPILVPDLSASAEPSVELELLRAASLQSVVSVPLLVHGQLIGTLNLVANTRGAFKPEHVDIATEVADQIAVMLRQARLHEQVQRHADELEIRVAERTRQLREANEQLKELDRAKDQFVSNVSHELRTPLANLKLYLSLLERGKPEKRGEYMQTLRREHSRLDRMIEDLLDLSRLDMGVTPIRPVPTDLNLLLSQLIADRAALAAEQQLVLDYQPDDDLPLALIDPVVLTEVITNLVGNAINYTPRGGVISVVTAAREHEGQPWVTFTVQDTGLGISAKDLPHLFERFYRGEVGRKAGAPGSGLGLAISKEIVEKLGGRILVASEPGQGAAFTVWLKPVEAR